MARADLLVNLVKAGIAGDTQGARTVAEAIIAEERSKQHTVLAERLDQVVRHGMRQRPAGQTAERHLAKELLYDLVPERRLEDLVLPSTVLRTCRQFIAEQQRASVLRAEGLSPRHRVLLVGPPGNGKTSLAESLAEALAGWDRYALEALYLSWVAGKDAARNEDARFLAWAKSFTKGRSL